MLYFSFCSVEQFKRRNTHFIWPYYQNTRVLTVRHRFQRLFSNNISRATCSPKLSTKKCFPPFLQTGEELLSNSTSVSFNTKIKFLSLPIPSCPVRKVKLRKGRRSVFILHTSFLQFNQGQGKVGPPSLALVKASKNLNQTYRVRERKMLTK